MHTSKCPHKYPLQTAQQLDWPMIKLAVNCQKIFQCSVNIFKVKGSGQGNREVLGSGKQDNSKQVPNMGER